jgi:hypothetical protein
VQLPDLKNFSVPIRIAKMAVAAQLTDGEKDPLEVFSDEENKLELQKAQGASQPTHKRKQASRIDLIDIFASNPAGVQSYPLESNSSTLALSSTHVLLHDNKKLILFDFHKKLYEFPWNDNDYGQ